MIGRIIMAFLILGLIAAAMKVVAGIVMLLCLLAYPRTTLGFVGGLIVLGLFARYPISAWCLVGAALFGCYLIGRNRRPPPDPPLGLPPPSAFKR